MPRPKQDPNALYVRELRITPPDGELITDWKITDTDFKIAIFAREGGSDGVRLHYHGYIESLRSESWIKKWIYSIAHCNNGESGNTVFFSRQPHENTIGYVVKHGDVVVRHGVQETFITEWLNKSKQYKLDKESDKKRSQRVNEKTRDAIKEFVKSHLQEHPELRYEEQVIGMLLEQYHKRDITFPPRSTIENMTCSLLYPYQPDIIRAFYSKNLSLNREYTNGLRS